MTIGEWLRDRTPAAPPALRRRLSEALGERGASALEGAPDACVAAAIELLLPLLAREGAGRECALDLLAADALVTYAFEAAASTPEGLDDLARSVMTRIAALSADAASA